MSERKDWFGDDINGNGKQTHLVIYPHVFGSTVIVTEARQTWTPVNKNRNTKVLYIVLHILLLWYVC